MAEYIPSPREWVRDQVEIYERSGGIEGTTLRDTGLPVIIVTHTGNKTGAVRKTPLMRVKDGANYILVGSMGGAPANPVWVYNLRVNPAVEIRDHTVVQPMRVREVKDEAERARLWDLAVAAYPPYAEYQTRTTRRIPLFVAEPEASGTRRRQRAASAARHRLMIGVRGTEWAGETVLRRACHANREYRVGASGDGCPGLYPES